MSTFGRLFRVTTFGESHCAGVGAVIDGCPPGLRLAPADIQPALDRRRPGQGRLTTARSEADVVSIVSGVEAGIALGTPITLLVRNEDQRPGDYASMARTPRPGHADYTYMVKYGVHAASGGGRSSARETIGRVAAGAVADKWLAQEFGTHIIAFVASVGDVHLPRAHFLAPSGRMWTRAEVDACGSFRLLRDAPRTGWSVAGGADATAADEAAFVAAAARALSAPTDTDASAETAPHAYVAGTPCYEHADGTLYDMLGGVVPADALTPDQLQLRRTDEVVSVRCPHAPTAARMASTIRRVAGEKDSIGGTVAGIIDGTPMGLGEPCFDKLQAMLAHAMMSLPAAKGFEIGSGFEGTRLRGSEHNDVFVAGTAAVHTAPATQVPTAGGSESASASTPAPTVAGCASMPALMPRTNHAGGVLGGISSGARVDFRVAIKPVSTIGRPQETLMYDGTPTTLRAKGRHDACVLPRTPALVEAMAALVIADLALLQRSRVGTLWTLSTREEEAEAEW